MKTHLMNRTMPAQAIPLALVALVSLLGIYSPPSAQANPVPRISVTTPASPAWDRIVIQYSITDSASSTYGLCVEYAIVQGAETGPIFRPATEAVGPPSDGVTNLTSTPSGATHRFVWNSFYDLNRRGLRSGKVVVRLRAIQRENEPESEVLTAYTHPFEVDNGLVATVAGNLATASSVGDGGPALGAIFGIPVALGRGPDGTIYLEDLFPPRVRAFSIGGPITTVAGNGQNGSTGDGGPATAATLDDPQGFFVDQNGILFIAGQDSLIRAVNPRTGIITTIAGGGASVTGGPALQCQLGLPSGFTALPPVGGTYQIIMTDIGLSDIMRLSYSVDASGNVANAVVDVVCGSAQANGGGGFSGDGGPASQAVLNTPIGIDVDSNGQLYFSDQFGTCVRRFTIGGNITTVAGSPDDPGYSGDGGPASAAEFSLVWGWPSIAPTTRFTWRILAQTASGPSPTVG